MAVDLNVFKAFDALTKSEDVFNDLKLCQNAVHQWGDQNQVKFDSSKEEFRVVHPRHGAGEVFKLLGAWVDNKLSMVPTIEKMKSKALPKVKAILRTQHFYDCASLVNQYKSHVLCLLETNTGAIYHASSSALYELDKVQNAFLRGLVFQSLKPSYSSILHPLASGETLLC